MIEEKLDFKNIEDQETLDHSQPPIKKKLNSASDPIKIYDQKQSEISYKQLSQMEKEKVLSELLFQSALNNIKKQVKFCVQNLKQFKKKFF